MYRKTLIAGLAIIAIPALPATAFAQNAAPTPNITPEINAFAIDEAASPDTSAQVAIPSEAIVPETALVPAIADGTLSDDDLLQLRGGEAIVIGNQTLTAINNGIAFTGNYTAGSVALTDNALSNFNGLGNLVINTGAQNNLQSAMNVTINFAQ